MEKSHKLSCDVRFGREGGNVRKRCDITRGECVDKNVGAGGKNVVA